uniref:Uncharacterized protein n=1 Tax=Ovis aries TaxID=9940 RepID=A0AC11E5G6_SHEEP
MDLEAASGITATCTGRISPPPRRATAASTGWTRRAAWHLPQSRVSARPGRRESGRRQCPNPGLWCLLSRLRRRQPQLLPEPGPGPARALVLRQRRGWSSREATLRGPALPRYPPQTPRPGLPRSCRSTRRARAAARRRPAPPRPALSDWPGLSPGRETRSLLAGAAARNELILSERLVNNRGQLGPAPRPSSAPGTPLGEPQKSVSLVHALSSPLGLGADTTSQGLPTSTTETEEAAEVPGGDEVFAPANALPARSEAAAVQPVIGISQRVRVNSKEKKDLGTLGYVLGITMMVIIIIIGAGIVLGYTYKRGKDLKAQHEQKACERELQRVTLPLSAFTNPTCEIMDEKTVVVHASQTPVDLQEGSAPLMGQAGTPGA